MNSIEKLPVALVTLLLTALSGCVSLPGNDNAPNTRFLVTGSQGDCKAGGETLALSVVAVNAGLDTDRIARRDAATGELSYLKGVRWADQLGPMLEQRMAQDLECAGYTVHSGHHHKLGQRQLICEVRAFNLVDDGADRGEVWLSCIDYRGGDGSDRALVSRRQQALDQWNATSAVAAISAAYRAALDEIIDGLR